MGADQATQTENAANGEEAEITRPSAKPRNERHKEITTMPRYPYPHIIENGGGERVTFARRVPGRNGGERIEGEIVAEPGVGPPMHTHHYQEEGMTVVQGRIGYQRLGETEQFAGPGETVVFKAGEAHRFWNAGEDELHCTAYVDPADNMEYFLTELFASIRRNGGTRPDPFEAAFLTRRYRKEFTMREIPAPVQRFVFPVLVAIGRLLGKYTKYADVPEPVHR
jgi:quercetin dioxygenase-like cupin family protein